MDLNILGLHIHELRNQCKYIEASVGILNQSLENEAPVGVFFALQSLLTSTSQVARLIWAPRKKGKERAEGLRKMMELPDKHPLNNDNILTLWEAADEANDQWVAQSKDQYILYDYIGDISKSEHKDVEIKNIFRAFDTETKNYCYRGNGFNMDALLGAISDVSRRINHVHSRLFPDQWKGLDENGHPIPKEDAKKDAKKSAAKKPATKKAAVKKPAPKKAAAKKPAVKKPAVKKVATKKPAAQKPAAKKSTPKKSAPKKKAPAKKKTGKA